MDLEHEFFVPTSITNAWSALADVPTVARCMPGAALDDVSDSPYTGTITVKVGAITIKFKGEATVTDRDERKFRMELSCKGVDVRGASTADALIVMQLADSGADTTRVNVTTNVQLSGKVAQFGRGMLQSVSDTILRKFVSNLEAELGVQSSQESGRQQSSESNTPTQQRATSADTQVNSAANRTNDEVIDLGAAALPALWGKYGPIVLSAVASLIAIRALSRARRTCPHCGKAL